MVLIRGEYSLYGSDGGKEGEGSGRLRCLVTSGDHDGRAEKSSMRWRECNLDGSLDGHVTWVLYLPYTFFYDDVSSLSTVHGRRTSKVKARGSPYSITERRVRSWSRFLAVSLQVMWVINPAVGCPLLSARPAVTPAALKRAATNFAAWWTDIQWVWTVCLRLLPDSVATAIWTRALLRLSPAR